MLLSPLASWIDEDFGLQISGGRYWRAREHDSLVYDSQRDLFFWNSRGIRGSGYYYLTRVRGLPREAAWKIWMDAREKWVPSPLPSPPTPKEQVYDESLADYFWLEGKKDTSYWKRRLFSDETIDRFRLGKWGDFYTLPIYADGKLENIQLRRDYPKKQIRLMFKRPPSLFNEDVLRYSDEVYITEGPTDAILLSQYGYPAISHVGGAGYWADEWFVRFIRQKIIYYVADNDTAGLLAAKKVARSLGMTRVKIVRFQGFPEKYDFIAFMRDGHTIQDFSYLVSKAKFAYQEVWR